MIAFHYQIKTLISFWCRRGLNPIFLIQTSEILPVELIRTHILEILLIILYRVYELIKRKINGCPKNIGLGNNFKNFSWEKNKSNWLFNNFLYFHLKWYKIFFKMVH